MRKPSFFTLGFLFVFFAIISFLFVLYSYLIQSGINSDFLVYFYGAIIFLFVLFGIIVVSLFYVTRFKKRR